MMKESIVLKLAKISDAQICIVCEDYISCITAATNLNFVQPAVSAAVATNMTAQIGVTKTSLTALKTAIAAPKSITRMDNIRIAREALDINITILANLVANVANAPNVLDANREAIIHSAGMTVKLKPTRKKPKFEALQSEEPGAILVIAGGKANAHLWAYTTDLVEFKDRVMAPPTTTISTIITGLEIGIKYAVFHMPITPLGPNLWEGPVFITVT